MKAKPKIVKFNKVLIANRGEIAVRIIRTLRELGIGSVAVYSDADSDSMHRFLADSAIRLGGKTSTETYLNVPAILQAIKVSGADAVHPGYGFLSENADFADQIVHAGATFIGPSSEAMRKMGDKVEARKLMRSADVPIVPGSDGPLSSWEELKSIAAKISYPLIIKAASGGGGRGMRVVRKDADLQEAFTACTREAKDYFGDPAIFCERYIEKGRHIEFQIMGDKYGHAVHLFERDCTVQRRHQKLIEEAPSSFLTPEARQRLGDIAIRAVKAVGYAGAGTLEFICESPERCYFMEMNTRIQVEHPVTEMITGVDLIREQIHVAMGYPLSVEQNNIQIRGWSIEARINAEDPTKGFAPNPGTINELKLPQGPFVRVDTHLYQGYSIPTFYDSMVAKVIVWGRDRNDAIAKMLRAFSEMKIGGIPTTTSFHEQVFRDPDFLSGDFSTRFVDEKGETLIKKIGDAKENKLDEYSAIFSALLMQLDQQMPPNNLDDRDNWTSRARSAPMDVKV